MEDLQLWRYSMQRWKALPAQPAIPENDPYEVPFPSFTDDLEAGQGPRNKLKPSFGFLGRGFRRIRETVRGATNDYREEAAVPLAEALYETDQVQPDEESKERSRGFLSSFRFGWLRNKKKQTDNQEPEFAHDEQYDYDYYDGHQLEDHQHEAYQYGDEYDDQQYNTYEDRQDADPENDEPLDDRHQYGLRRYTLQELIEEVLGPRDPGKEYSPISGVENLTRHIKTSFDSLSRATEEEEAALVRLAETSAEIAALVARVRFPPRTSSKHPPTDWPLTSTSRTSRNRTPYRDQPFSIAALKHLRTADPPTWAACPEQRHSGPLPSCSSSASPSSSRTAVHAPQILQRKSSSQLYTTSPRLPSNSGLSPVSPLGPAAVLGRVASRHSSVSSIHLTPPRSFTNIQKQLADLQKSGAEPFKTLLQRKSPASPFSLIPEPNFSLGQALRRFHRFPTTTSSSEDCAPSLPSKSEQRSSSQASTSKQSPPSHSSTAEGHAPPKPFTTEQHSQAPSSNTEQGPPPGAPKSRKLPRLTGFTAPSLVPKSPSRPASNPEMDPTRLAPEPVSDDKKQQAIQDARDMYSHTLRVCEKLKIPVPPYDFLELIGKGGSGRVYKCRDRNTGDLVAIKTVDTDSVDYSNHTLEKDNTIKDFQKEVATLQKLKDSRARNINVIHDALEIGTSLWIVSDYCTGGSVRTLMRALPPGQPGLEEKYIIIIARELLVALVGLHSMGVIHRDIKGTNVYITETGALQLGDYGVVGVTDDENNKRKTILGTPHWMPREFFVQESEVLEGYGSEIDIWAFGCTIFEMATGTPPNARLGPGDLGKALLKAPRLEGEQYSSQLRDFVAFCLNTDPQKRPTAEEALEHPYVANTQKKYPTSTLIKLIERYKLWEYGGGIRQSLWLPGGAAPVPAQAEPDFDEEEVEDDDDWNFSTSDDFNTNFERRFSHMFSQATKDMDFNLPNPSLEGHPPWVAGSRAPPPIDTTGPSRFEMLQADWAEESASRGEDSLARLYRLSASEYKLHSRMTEAERKMDKGDLPLRSSTQNTNAHESIIDLSTAGYDPSAPINFDFVDAPTLKARKSRAISVVEDEEDDYEYSSADDNTDKRATMEWTFPSTSKKVPSPKRATMDWTFASARPAEPEEQEISMDLPPPGDGNPPPAFRPTLKHTQTMPLGGAGDYIHSTQSYRPATSPIRDSMASMIDLDMGMVDDNSEISRPGTAISTTGSHFSDMTSGNPFDLEEDPNQNELDRNRFSYHKQWQSEGGHVDHRHSARKSIPMHTRGSSLSSTDNDHLDRRSNGLTYALPGARPSNGHGKNSSIIVPDTIDLDSWPNFDQPGVEVAPSSATSSDHDNEGVHIPLRQRGTGPARRAARKKGVIAFPQVVGPSEAALAEDASVETLAAELDRMCGDLDASLQATKQAFAQYAGLDDEEGSEGGSGYE